jgi:hypothetical protein
MNAKEPKEKIRRSIVLRCGEAAFSIVNPSSAMMKRYI